MALLRCSTFSAVVRCGFETCVEFDELIPEVPSQTLADNSVALEMFPEPWPIRALRLCASARMRSFQSCVMWYLARSMPRSPKLSTFGQQVG